MHTKSCFLSLLLLFFRHASDQLFDVASKLFFLLKSIDHELTLFYHGADFIESSLDLRDLRLQADLLRLLSLQQRDLSSAKLSFFETVLNAYTLGQLDIELEYQR